MLELCDSLDGGTVSGWRGYGCTDGNAVRSIAWQLAYTLLLTLTNLAFIPAIILSIYRRYLVEALVYTANMVFSGVSVGINSHNK